MRSGLEIPGSSRSRLDRARAASVSPAWMEDAEKMAFSEEEITVIDGDRAGAYKSARAGLDLAYSCKRRSRPEPCIVAVVVGAGIVGVQADGGAGDIAPPGDPGRGFYDEEHTYAAGTADIVRHEVGECRVSVWYVSLPAGYSGPTYLSLPERMMM